jgi:hypothetical protein
METRICSQCNTEKPLDAFYVRKSGKHRGKPFRECIECDKTRVAAYSADHREKARTRVKKFRETHKRKSYSIKDVKESSFYLGVHVSERALSNFFDHIERMPMGNPGYDFLCGRGHKIDVKSSCLHRPNCKDHPGTARWTFSIFRNRVADYFLCLAFDNIDDLNPQHVWLIPGNIINNKSKVSITNSARSLPKWSVYERPLDRVLACCETMKSKS